MRKLSILICLGLILSFQFGNAQIAISDTFANPTPDNSAILDLQSFEKGFLPPRMNQSQRDNIVGPAEGLVIYNLTSSCAEIYIQGAWKAIACACTAAPGTPGAISGPATVCPNQVGVGYSVANDPNASSYSWSVPAGASITSGQGTSAIVVDFGSSSGNVSVSATNACGSSALQTQSVTIQNADAAFTYSPSNPQIGQTVNFSASTGGQTYSWSFPSGTPATSSSATPSVSWAAGGTYDVILTATRAGGCMDSDTQSVTVISCPSNTVTFSFTGGMQTYTVPSCVDSMHIQVWGAEGGTGAGGSPPQVGLGGLGGFSEGYIMAAGGTTLNIYVGGQGGAPTAGYNGGGVGANGGCCWGAGGGGGGASDIRIGGTMLSNRIIVAGGGGGGGGREGSYGSGAGGDGGGTTGDPGIRSQGNPNHAEPGQGGTQSAGGTFGCYIGGGHCGTAGAPGQGGTASNSNSYSGGAGGGGYFGGGGGGNWAGGAGGGGGSGYIGGVSGGSMQSGIQSGNGQITISW